YQGTSPGNLLVDGVIQTGKGIGVPVSGDVIGVAVDFTNHLAWFRRNSGNWNNDGTANPATGVGGITIAAGSYAPTVGFGAGGSARTTTGNFGASTYALTK